MLRYCTTISLVSSIISRMRLLNMDQAGGGVPSTICLVSFMGCTWTITLPIKLSGPKKRNIRSLPIINKLIRASMTTQTPIIMETKKSHSLFHPRFSPQCALIVGFSSNKCQKWWICTTSQTWGPGRQKS